MTVDDSVAITTYAGRIYKPWTKRGKLQAVPMSYFDPD